MVRMRATSTQPTRCVSLATACLVEILPHPPIQRDQSFGTRAIDSLPPVRRSIHEPCGLQQLEMLDDGGARNRQALSQFAGRHGHTRKPLEDDHPNRMTEQREQPQNRSERRSVRVRPSHGEVSGQTDRFGKWMTS